MRYEPSPVPERIDAQYLDQELQRIANSINLLARNFRPSIVEETAVASSGVVLLNASATAVHLLLPPANRTDVVTVIRTDNSANKAVVKALGDNSINGGGSATLSAQYQIRRIESDGRTNYYTT